MLKNVRVVTLYCSLLCAVGVGSVFAEHNGYDDPPGRVAYLSDSRGEVSFSPAGEDDWVAVIRNRPLISGDRLWTERNARAELQVGASIIRLGSGSSFEILDLDDRVMQLQLNQGTLELRVRRMDRDQVVEVDTPALAFTISRAGRYRIDVDPDDDLTTIVVREGAGDAYGDDSSFPLRAGDAVRFYGSDLRDYELIGTPRADGFDRYARDRDRRFDQSNSLRYVDEDMIGYEELDDYGNWRGIQGYGNVWFPSRVNADWAPYRDGHWAWQEPWGWTWVDAAPWGFAPSHYGRWAHLSGRWGWIPGPRNLRPTYAPALVAFIGGSGFNLSLSIGGSSPVGWFPLGPREVYVPSYRGSRDYFNRVNVSNTVINNTTITNVYNNYASGNAQITQVNYANRSIAGAVTAVPGDVFSNARPVRAAALRLDRNAFDQGQVRRFAAVAPSRHSVLGANAVSRTAPARSVLNRQVFARRAPPPEQQPFAARVQQLQRTPGRAAATPRTNAPTAGRANAERRNLRVIAKPEAAVNARSSSGGRGKPGESAAPRAKPVERSEPMRARPQPTPAPVAPARPDRRTEGNQGNGRPVQTDPRQPRPNLTEPQQPTQPTRSDRDSQRVERGRPPQTQPRAAVDPEPAAAQPRSEQPVQDETRGRREPPTRSAPVQRTQPTPRSVPTPQSEPAPRTAPTPRSRPAPESVPTPRRQPATPSPVQRQDPQGPRGRPQPKPAEDGGAQSDGHSKDKDESGKSDDQLEAEAKAAEKEARRNHRQ